MTFSPAPKPKPREPKPPQRPRAKNVKRSADTFIRAYHSEERVAFVQSLPCVVAGCKRPSENAHITGDGMGRKAVYSQIAPICSTHHRQLHEMGRERFEGYHLVDLGALALDTERTWRRFAGHTHTETDR